MDTKPELQERANLKIADGQSWFFQKVSKSYPVLDTTQHMGKGIWIDCLGPRYRIVRDSAPIRAQIGRYQAGREDGSFVS